MVNDIGQASRGVRTASQGVGTSPAAPDTTSTTGLESAPVQSAPVVETREAASTSNEITPELRDQVLSSLSHSDLRTHPEFTRAYGDAIRSERDRGASEARREANTQLDERRYQAMSAEQQKDYLYHQHQRSAELQDMRSGILSDMSNSMQDSLFELTNFPQERFGDVSNTSEAGVFARNLFELGVEIGRASSTQANPAIADAELGAQRRVGEQSPATVPGTATAGALNPADPDGLLHRLRTMTDEEYIEAKKNGLLDLIPSDMPNRVSFKR